MPLRKISSQHVEIIPHKFLQDPFLKTNVNFTKPFTVKGFMPACKNWQSFINTIYILDL